MILFSESAKFSEEISSKKYPDYQKYVNTVSKFVPGFSLTSIDSSLVFEKKDE